MTENPPAGSSEGTVAFEHGGAVWHIPTDLIETQRAFDEADAACNQAVAAMDEAAYKAASTARMDAVLALHRHPWLREAMAAGHRHQADMALKACVRGS